MFPYIYTEQNGIHVIDLVQTARLLTHASNYVQKAAKEGKSFLFIGTKRQASEIIAEQAKRCNSHYVNNRWLRWNINKLVNCSRTCRLSKRTDSKGRVRCFSPIAKKRGSIIKTRV